jgi:hypothetical protein
MDLMSKIVAKHQLGIKAPNKKTIEKIGAKISKRLDGSVEE